MVDENWLVAKMPRNPIGSSALEPALTTRERQMIESALAECRGRVAGPNGAATRLGIPVSTLESKIKSLTIDKYRFKSS
jgi:formate hydrogenlyase transcriptional activator